MATTPLTTDFKSCCICNKKVLLEYLTTQTHKLRGFYCGCPCKPDNVSKLVHPKCKEIICLDCFIAQNFYCPAHKREEEK